jgi:molybdate transport system ATP-binding protein
LAQALADRQSPLHAEQGPASVFDAIPLSTHTSEGLLQVAIGQAQCWVAAAEPPPPRLRLRILARDVVLARDPPGRSSALNVLPVLVTEVADLDSASVLVRCEIDADTPLLAAITRRSARLLELQPGHKLWAQIKTTALD